VTNRHVEPAWQFMEKGIGHFLSGEKHPEQIIDTKGMLILLV
jgi:hypothetical protein